MDMQRFAGQDQKYCTSCGQVIMSAAEICPHCGVRQMAPPRQQSVAADPALPMALNGCLPFFGFMGIGHMVAGRLGRGIAVLIIGWALTLLFWLTIGFAVGIIFLPVILFLWIWSIFDVKKVVQGRDASSRGPGGDGPFQFHT